MEKKITKAMDLVNSAIIALYKEKFENESNTDVLQWCEIVDEDNEPILESKLSYFFSQQPMASFREGAWFGLFTMLNRFTSDKISNFKDANWILDAYSKLNA